MSQKLRSVLISLLLIASMILSGCGPGWSFSLRGPFGKAITVDRLVWKEYEDLAGERGVPLEKILYDRGYRIINQMKITNEDGREFAYAWEEEATAAWLKGDGNLVVGEREIRPEGVRATSSSWMSKVESSIVDIAPTAAGALDIPLPELATGSNLVTQEAEHVLLLFLDGFGYVRAVEAEKAGLTPVLSGLGSPRVGLTTYPPITTVSTASLLTGTEPMVHGVEARGTRNTDKETLFEVADQAGLGVRVVEGEALAFQFNGADIQLSGDRNQDGNTDDNVLANTVTVLEDGMPDLFLVHFHGIDDLGHEFGPGHPREEEKIREVDHAVGQILELLPRDTLVIVFADHGMHRVQGEERKGNHGHLIPRDMLIPLWITYRD